MVAFLLRLFQVRLIDEPSRNLGISSVRPASAGTMGRAVIKARDSVPFSASHVRPRSVNLSAKVLDGRLPWTGKPACTNQYRPIKIRIVLVPDGGKHLPVQLYSQKMDPRKKQGRFFSAPPFSAVQVVLVRLFGRLYRLKESSGNGILGRQRVTLG